jgi:hypothetical protein
VYVREKGVLVKKVEFELKIVRLRRHGYVKESRIGHKSR